MAKSKQTPSADAAAIVASEPVLDPPDPQTPAGSDPGPEASATEVDKILDSIEGAIPNEPIAGEILPPLDAGHASAIATSTGYVSRIHILEAWRYPGSLAGHPPYVDPSWAAWGDVDIVRGIDASPALRVPTAVGNKMCRIGDYVVRQSITIIEGLNDEQVDVWARDQFEKLFMPVIPTDAPTPPPSIPTKGYMQTVNERAARANAAKQPIP